MIDTLNCQTIVTDTFESGDSTADLKRAGKLAVQLTCSAIVVYLLAFVVLILVPGIANKLRTIGVNEALLEKVFYPLLQLIR
jgi:hypothetical protein